PRWGAGGGAGRARPRAVLGRVARAGRGAAHRAGGLEAVGWTRRAGTGARLRHVAGARRGATHGSGVTSGVATRPGAARVGGAGVAVVGAARAVRLEGVRGAGRARRGKRVDLAVLGRAGGGRY